MHDSMDLKRFPQFGRLPLDIRRIIWQYALAIPRIVELEAMPYDLRVSREVFHLGALYRPKSPYALMTTCRESREESLRIYELDTRRNKAEGGISNPWIRFDCDIVHFKDLYFAGNYSGYTLLTSSISRSWWAYNGRPALFEHIEAVAMPWEFWRTERINDLILNFFPKLKILIFLIDDSEPNAPRHKATSLVDITKLYKEPDLRNLLPAFVQDATGPFTEVVSNKEFEGEVLDLCSRYLSLDERTKIIVRGCRLAPRTQDTEMDNIEGEGERIGRQKSAGLRSCCSLM